MRSQFINSQEKLLIWSEHGEHISTDEQIERAADVLGFADESAVKIFRVDNEWLFEDVTEQVVEAWLEKYGENPAEMNVKGCGPWLEDSTSLSDYIDDYDYNARSDYDEHNTLNHAQQGLSRR